MKSFVGKVIRFRHTRDVFLVLKQTGDTNGLVTFDFCLLSGNGTQRKVTQCLRHEFEVVT